MSIFMFFLGETGVLKEVWLSFAGYFYIIYEDFLNVSITFQFSISQ